MEMVNEWAEGGVMTDDLGQVTQQHGRPRHQVLRAGQAYVLLEQTLAQDPTQRASTVGYREG